MTAAIDDTILQRIMAVVDDASVAQLPRNCRATCCALPAAVELVGGHLKTSA
jgi:hypothetical protein